MGIKLQEITGLLSRTAFIAVCAVVPFALVNCGVDPVDQEGISDASRSVLVSGTVFDSSDNPLEGVFVRSLNDGQFSITDKTGGFSFLVVRVEENRTLDFLIESPTFSVVVYGPNVSFEQLRIHFKINPDLNSAEIYYPEMSTSPTEEEVDSGEMPDAIFDAEGNTTAFGIPKGLVGNLHAGKRKYQQECASCHLDPQGGNLNFYELRNRISEAPMFKKIHDSNLADIVAYLHYLKGER
ncbi:MAG: carboxypeptidase regulatory-like domain-containing protein [Bdellovibrionales bacterium]|nr:carboxypeptidase regulatory-like domain-containing protein [Bdellovibrionales bacterium]